MTGKSAAVQALVAGIKSDGRDVRFLGFFACFNRGLYYEAHDVLEDLWLEDRQGPNGRFYKGLIQLAGAFVHLQKNRRRPAAALLQLARANLAQYPAHHEHLDVAGVIALAELWEDRLTGSSNDANPLSSETAPRIDLLPPGKAER